MFWAQSTTEDYRRGTRGTHTHTHTRAHARARTYTRKHAHTHIHTRARKRAASEIGRESGGVGRWAYATCQVLSNQHFTGENQWHSHTSVPFEEGLRVRGLYRDTTQQCAGLSTTGVVPGYHCAIFILRSKRGKIYVIAWTPAAAVLIDWINTKTSVASFFYTD